MKDFRIEKLANNLLNYSVKLQKGENILIEILGEDGIPLGEELIKQAEQLGAKPFFNIINYFKLYPSRDVFNFFPWCRRFITNLIICSIIH